MTPLLEAVAEAVRAVDGARTDRVELRVCVVRALVAEIERFEICRTLSPALTADAGYCHAIDTLRKALAVALGEVERLKKA
jgi:hypothetical protein